MKSQFLDFCKFMSFSTAEKLVGYISLKNEVQLQKVIITSLPNVMEFHRRENSLVSFAHVVVIKYRKTVTLSFI